MALKMNPASLVLGNKLQNCYFIFQSMCSDQDAFTKCKLLLGVYGITLLAFFILIITSKNNILYTLFSPKISLDVIQSYRYVIQLKHQLVLL